MNTFAGTAKYYDEFRPGVPQEVIDTILPAVGVPVTLLDLGAGTGRITEQFAKYFDETIGIEPDKDMVKLARHRLAHLPAKIVRTTAEEMLLPKHWHASLVTICRSFHWMDQRAVLGRLESIVAQDGVIAVLADNSFWALDEDWTAVVRDTLTHYLGPERRTLYGTYKPPLEYFGHTFTSPVFTHLERYRIPVVREWTIDQIIGYLYSTSFASHAVLGADAPVFEKILRKRLESMSPENTFTEHNHFGILLARRP